VSPGRGGKGEGVQDRGQGGRGSLTHREAGQIAPGNLRGIAAMVAATALFTCGDAAMKLVSGSLPTGETVFIRGVCTVTIVTVAAFWTGAIYRLRDAFVRAMGWRSAGDVGSALFFQAALARMPFADLMGILQMTPLSLTAASALFLGEHVGWRRWTAVAIGFTGALLVIKPGSSAFNAWALLGVLSVLCGSLRDISTRRLDVALSPLLIMMLSQVVVASSGLACWTFETWAVPSLAELFCLVFASVFSLAGHLCVIFSLRSGEVAAVAPFRYAGIVWSILLGFMIWNQLPDVLSLSGILILVSAGMYTFYREQRLRKLASLALRP
jgi:drug/metabolite transporter (DMT)-like permease